jgi:hypothetical protein
MTITRSVIANHDCFICDGATEYYFSKSYPPYPGCPFSGSLEVDYLKCKNCGFVFSKTHKDMEEKMWQSLNATWHHHFENDASTFAINQPPYVDQALALFLLTRNKILDLSNALDYAAGYGTFAKILNKYFDIKINLYDKYVQDTACNIKYLSTPDLNKYMLVINSAMFEHVLDRASLDEVNNLVDKNGALAIHTRICENIPDNPNWFYLDPIVHTAFHTNKSMSILMRQWGYEASVYCPSARLWILFKKDHHAIADLESFVINFNKELQSQYFYYKHGFVDFWKTS